MEIIETISPNSVSMFLKKLHRKPDQSVLILGAPNELKSLLASDGVHFDQELNTKHAFLILFCFSSSDIERFATQIKTYIGTASIWFAYPKRPSKITTDLSRDQGWDPILNLGLLPVTQIALNESWSALRFRHKREIKRMTRGIEHPSVNSKTKEVTLPTDLEEALIANNLKNKFDLQSFTFRKEAVLSVVDAKKIETRKSRILTILSKLNSGN